MSQSLGWSDTTTAHSENASGVPPAQALVPGLTVLAHPDPQRVGERALLDGLASGRALDLSRHAPEFAQPGEPQRRPLLDAHLSREPLRLRRGSTAGAVILDPAGSRTPVVVDGVALAGPCELTAERVARGVVLLLGGHVALLLHRLDPLAGAGAPDCGMVGASHALDRLRREVARVAATEVTVLLSGETGSGKELAARAIHDLGPRAGRPYVAVNLAAVPPALAAAELFGAARGAFTGAERDRSGFFGAAQRGTLFLDEVGEAPAEVQVLLLRALESGEVQPVGSGQPRSVDVRVIAASDADLQAAVARGRFRAPLLHRLASYHIDVPPLRARRDDVARLLIHFLRQELAAIDALARLDPPRAGRSPWLGAELTARLCAYDWPGNVRQLRNVARRLALGGHDADVLDPALVEPLLGAPAAVAAPPAASVEEAPGRRPRWRDPQSVDDDELRAALERNRWRVQPTATELGLSRTSLYARLDALPGLRTAARIGGDELRACHARCGGDLESMVRELRVSPHGLRRRMRDLDLP